MEQKIPEVRQCDRETEGWKKILGILQLDNIAQKNKLAELLKNNSGNDQHLVESAEQYQNWFLQQDEAARLMFKDISEYEKLSGEIDVFDRMQLKKLNQIRNRLEKETKALELNFIKLRSEFNNVLC